MPELPEVETTIKGLNILNNLKIIKVFIHTKKLRYLIPISIYKIEKNAIITNIERLGKYILIHLSVNYSLVLHLGMSGRLKVVNKLAKRDKHDHFILKFHNSKYLIFNDIRKFGFVDFDKTNIIYKRKYFSILGIDALGKGLDQNYLYKKIYKSEVPIKQILLNQNIIAGIGNIYASEILFDARISPLIKGKNLDLIELKIIIKSIRKILKKAIRLGGSSIRDYVSVDGTLGNFQSKFLVYNKKGEKIYNNKIIKIVQYGRSTYYCPGLQKSKRKIKC